MLILGKQSETRRRKVTPKPEISESWRFRKMSRTDLEMKRRMVLRDDLEGPAKYPKRCEWCVEKSRGVVA